MALSTTSVFRLGGEDRDRLEILVLARNHPGMTDYWDGNWLRAQVTVVAGPWAGSYRAGLRADEFAAFREQLQRLYDDPAGPGARFESMEPWLRFTVQRTDRLGHVEVRGEARVEPFVEDHNVLKFSIEIDQSYLPHALEHLRKLLTVYPVLGSPNE
jgi:hypothetical protein